MRNPELLPQDWFHEPDLMAARLARYAELECECFAAALDGGFVDFMDGEQPASHRDPITAQRALVTFALGAPAFYRPVEGAVSLRPVADAVAVAEGEVTWCRLYRADHRTPVRDLSAGADPDREAMLETAFTVAGSVHVLTSLTYLSWTPRRPPQS